MINSTPINNSLSNANSSSFRVKNTENNENKVEDISILTAGKSVLAALTDSLIMGTGNTLVTLKNLPKISINTFKAIKNTELIGPNLKALLFAILPLGIATAPALTALASFLFGLFKGVDDILDNKKTLAESISDTINTVSKFDNKILKEELQNIIKDFENEKLEDGQKPVDIKVYETFRGVIASLINGAIGTAVFPTVTLANLPSILINFYKEVLKNQEIGPVYKSTIIILSLLALPLIPPLSTVGGTIYGLYKGLTEGYKEGISKSISELLKDVKEYNKFLKTLNKNEEL
ncbi:MAG: hypothetical protein N2485_01165 [bacterium]|nr:hypothetical protein [bacterium]